MRCFPSVCRFELTSGRHGVCRPLGYCDGWRSRIVRYDWNFKWQNPTEIHSALREVCGAQTVDHSTVSRWATCFREVLVTIKDDQSPGRLKTSADERSVKFVADFVERRARKYHKLPGFHQHQNSVLWQPICRKEKFVLDGSLTAWLLNRNRNTWKLQHYWNKDLTLKVKHSCIELSLSTKRGLETLNRSWNRSQTSGEV